MNQTKIRWLIAHEPINLFLRTAEAFAEKIAELTNNAYTVEIFTPSDYKASKEARLGYPVAVDPMIDLENGELEMSQLQIGEFGRNFDSDFLALELPFIFRDHDHVARVLEGDIGQNMLSGLRDRSPVTGMAFTYSGGFRCVASDKALPSIEDLRGLKFATLMNPVCVDTINAFGAIPETFTVEDFNQKISTEGLSADALETTIPRFLAQLKHNSDKRYLVNTKHNIFLTTIIVSNKFLDTLDADTKLKFYQACQYAAKLERQWSVDDAENFAAQEDHSDIGVSYREVTEKETQTLKELSLPVIEKYRDFFSSGLVNNILNS